LDVVSAKALAKGWRYGVVVIAVLAAMITPTVDQVNMALLMVPLLVLYALSVFFAYLAGRREDKKSKEE
jgi:sec-independent protein translocase protein TatC